MSSSDEFFDADNSSANEEAEKVVKQPTKAPGEYPQSNRIRRPVTLGFEPKFDFLSIEDDGLMTPNSTVNSITADYTREMILSQNRRSQLMSNSNGQSNDSISSPNPSNSNKSSSIEREREKDEMFKRHSLESRYFSCSDFFETENGNFEFRRDDSIRSSLSSRPERKSKTPRKAPKRPPQPSLTAVAQNSVYRHSYLGSEGSSYISPILRVRTLPNGTQSEIRPSHPGAQKDVTNPTGLTRSHSNPKFRTLTFSNDLDLTQFAQYAKEQKTSPKDEHDSVETERTGSNSKTARIQNWRQDSQANKLFEMQDQIDRRSISNSSSISSDHSSIASSASAMARKARSVKTLISKTFKKRRNKAQSTLSLLTESSIESNCEYKIKDSRNFPKTSLRHLDNMKLHQVLHTTSKRTENSGIIVMKFNSDGNLLASAGKDSYVYVWVMNTSKHLFNTQNSRKSTEITAEQLKELENEIQNDGPFSPVPLRKYFGHTDHVVDLSWSYKQSDNWLLSCSIDKSIRLWHVSKHETIALFKNQEIPKSILFHPKDNCKFIAGFLDGKVELWNTPNKKLTHQYKAESISKNGGAITSILFLSKRDQVALGTMDGRCILLDIRENDFAFHTEILFSEGRPITGIEPTPNDPNIILVTATDSKIRLYSFQDNCVICRYKGLTNNNALGMFMKGVFSPDGRFIASGSEDGNIYSWEKSQLQFGFKNKRDKINYFQYVKCFGIPVHSVQFVPHPAQLGSECIRALVSSDENGDIKLFSRTNDHIVPSMHPDF